MSYIGKFFKELNPDDFREFVVFIFGFLGYVYLFLITFIPIPPDNHDIRTAGMTLVSTVIFGRMIVEFVNRRKEIENKEKENKEIENQG